MTPRPKEDLAYRRRYRRTARAYDLKLEFDDLWKLSAAEAPGHLHDWCDRVYRTRLELLKEVVDTVDTHRHDVLGWFQSPTACLRRSTAWSRQRRDAPAATGPTSAKSP